MQLHSNYLAKPKLRGHQDRSPLPASEVDKAVIFDCIMGLVGDPRLHYPAKPRRSHSVVRGIEHVVAVPGAQLCGADQATGVYAIALVEWMQLRFYLNRCHTSPSQPGPSRREPHCHPMNIPPLTSSVWPVM